MTKKLNIENETISKDTGQLKLHELPISIDQIRIFFALYPVRVFLKIISQRTEILRLAYNIEKQETQAAEAVIRRCKHIDFCSTSLSGVNQVDGSPPAAI